MLDKKVLFCSADSHGCGWYRTKLIADYLKADHCWFFPAHKDPEGNLTLKDERVFAADIIVLQRHGNPFFFTAIPQLQSLGKKVVYDIDDNLWNISASNVAHNLFSPQMLKEMKQIIKLCDYVTVSTEPLRLWMLKENFNQNIIVVPNMLEDVFDFVERDNSKIRIGYAGSPTHAGDFHFKLCEALRKSKTHKDCELIFLGYNPIKAMSCEHNPGVEVEKYMDTLNSLNLDIAIAPLADNLFNQCKSNLKFLEYSACGFPTIASNVYPYLNTINDGENGVLVYNDKEWFSRLIELIDNKEYRISLAKNAHSYVKENFTYKYNGNVVLEKWEQIIGEMYK